MTRSSVDDKLINNDRNLYREMSMWLSGHCSATELCLGLQTKTW